MNEYHRLKKFRKSLKLSQKDFANKLNLQQGSYGDIERGKVGISSTVLKMLITQFYISPVWLYTGKGRMYLPDEKSEELKIKYLKQQYKEKIACLQKNVRSYKKTITIQQKYITLLKRKKSNFQFMYN
ncbi:MAG: helix-turn-helix domain-containing protein [Cyclobacteriaceae bacterium]